MQLILVCYSIALRGLQRVLICSKYWISYKKTHPKTIVRLDKIKLNNDVLYDFTRKNDENALSYFYSDIFLQNGVGFH